MYFFKDLTPLNIPCAEFNQYSGYSSNYPIYMFTVLNQKKSDSVIHGLGLQRLAEADFNTAIAELDKNKDLDAKRETYQRTEQGFLRDQLFSRKTVAICALCGREFPIELLRAAHIKRRAECSEEEKRDYKNNVMPTCTFGCDELFERGYLAVMNGKVKSVADHPLLSDAVKDYLERVNGRDCSWWHEGSKPYFLWHSSEHEF